MEQIKVGEKYGKLTVIENHHPKDEVLCRCECGNFKIARASNVYSGGTKSCGCLFAKGNNLKHGDRYSRLYGIWRGIKERCDTPSCSTYKNYGARGITYCSEWRDYLTFKEWALNNGYAENLTIDRIDVNGNYEPNNCRWTTYKIQGLNRRNNRNLSFNGVTKTLSEWAEETGIKSSTIWARLKRGWSIEKTLTTEVK